MYEAVDWSETIPDILADIINRLELIDFIRSSVVCQSWRSTICGGNFFCQPKSDQMPWLLLSSLEEPEMKFLYNPREAASLYKFNLPSISNHVIRGSSGGFIITIDDAGQVHATNPITKAHRLLPDPATFSCLGDRVIDPLHGIVKINKPFMFSYYGKVVIAPGFNGLMAVLIKSAGAYQLAFACENENSWTEITESPLYNFNDVLVHKGLLYAVGYTGQLVVFDLHAPPSPRLVIFVKDVPEACDTDGKMYLVESLCGSDIFLIARDTDYDPPNEDDDNFSYHRTVGFSVFKLDQTQHEWVQVSSFGDDVAAFVGLNQSIMVSTADPPSGVVRKNCIYFTDDIIYAIPMGDHGEQRDKEIFSEDVGVYCMETQTVMPFDLSAYHQRHFTFPPPVWFVPTF